MFLSRITNEDIFSEFVFLDSQTLPKTNFLFKERICSSGSIFSIQSKPLLLRKAKLKYQGPVVQSIVSLTSSLRGHLVKCFTTLQPNTLIFFVEKTREAFALQKLLTVYQQKKYWHISDINI